ncbi:hypothetical protein ColTof3_08390 [Colletotrichum tofieldiae]|nr:hypothetical protein ColTof3_08390 [Colletotrichum tofieldiae]
MRAILGSDAIKHEKNRLFFSFASHDIRMPCAVFSCPTPPIARASVACDVTVPTIAYLDHSNIRSAREDSLQYLRTSRFGKSPESLYYARLAQTTPPDRMRDPYVVPLLFALAQAQRRHLIRRTNTKHGAEACPVF